MIEPNLRQQIIELIHREVVPATGCTEPVAVALAVARAAQELIGNREYRQIEILLSPNVLKNALGVGIPGTGMIGLPIAVALGAVIAKAEKGLTILEGFSESTLQEAKLLVEKGLIQIGMKDEQVDKLYIEARLTTVDGEKSTAVIAFNHSQVVFVSHNEEPLLGHYGMGVITQELELSDRAPSADPTLDFETVFTFATQTPLEEIEFIMEAARLNQDASKKSLQGEYGHAVGRMIQSPRGRQYLGNSMLTQILTATSAACDARMDGAPVTVMSNSGSGNQGITASLPVITFAEQENASHEDTVRSLMLSALMVIYIKQKLGRLSALCGCVVAATGASCGLTYLMGGDRTQITYAIKNMVGNITGMLCDGAKPSCSMKVSSGVSTAMFSALLAMEGKVVTSNEGVVDDDVDRTIDNLTRIGRDGMSGTDSLVLDIMTSKQEKRKVYRPE